MEPSRKGAPGKSNLRDLLEYGPAGPPSVRCGGFDFELSIVSGSAVVTFADQSQLYASVDSGYTCGNVADGAEEPSSIPASWAEPGVSRVLPARHMPISTA